MLNVTHLRTWLVVIFVEIPAVMLVKGILVFINSILPQLLTQSRANRPEYFIRPRASFENYVQ